MALSSAKVLANWGKFWHFPSVMSRNIRTLKIGGSVLLRARELLEPFFLWLLDPQHFPEFGGRRTPELHLNKVRAAIRAVQAILAYAPDNRAHIAVKLLQNRQTEIEAQKGWVTYSSPYCSYFLPRGWGNMEEAMRLFVSVEIARLLYPAESPYDVVKAALQSKGQIREPKAIEMRVRRFARALKTGKIFLTVPGDSPEQRLYRDFKQEKFMSEHGERLDELPQPFSKKVLREWGRRTRLREYEKNILRRLHDNRLT